MRRLFHQRLECVYAPEYGLPLGTSGIISVAGLVLAELLSLT